MSLEFMVADRPLQFPFLCVACALGQGGPVLDTHREVLGYGHVYVCRDCIRKGAIGFGFAPGEKLDELTQAAVTLTERDREIASLTEQLSKSNDSRKSTVKHDQHLEVALVQARERIAQLEQHLRLEAGNALSLAGVGDGAEA
jgi:hypothetical protein